LAVTEKLVARGDIRPTDRVVVISTAHGLKFTDFKVNYHELKLEGIESQLPNPPIEMRASYDAVRSELMRQIDRRFGNQAAGQLGS
jgi:threonine synthase